MDTSAGTDELFLYFCWWMLAGAALLAIGTLRAHLPLAREDDGSLACGHFVRELTFVLSVLAATAAHLYAMNYAFVGHARLFYAAPLLLALTVLGFDGVARTGSRRRSLLIVFGCLPLLALLAAVERFDPEVPVHALPIWSRDPLLTMLASATIVWWFGAWRTRSSTLFHIGTLALACTAYRAASTLVIAVPAAHLPPVAGLPQRDAATVALWLITGYLLISACVRRSRIEAVLGLAILQVATFVSVWDETWVALFTIGIAACWSILAVLHLGAARPRLGTVLWPIAFMLIMGWCADLHEGLRWTARLHTAFVVFALLVFGQLWPSTRYCRVAAGVFVFNALFFAGRGIALGTLPARTVVVLSGFLLLIAGALVSWNKRSLLQAVRGPQPPKLPSPRGVDG